MYVVLFLTAIATIVLTYLVLKRRISFFVFNVNCAAACFCAALANASMGKLGFAAFEFVILLIFLFLAWFGKKKNITVPTQKHTTTTE